MISFYHHMIVYACSLQTSRLPANKKAVTAYIFSLHIGKSHYESFRLHVAVRQVLLQVRYKIRFQNTLLKGKSIQWERLIQTAISILIGCGVSYALWFPVAAIDNTVFLHQTGCYDMFCNFFILRIRVSFLLSIGTFKNAQLFQYFFVPLP